MTTAQNKYLFTVTHFDTDPDRVATPLVLANNALAAGADVLVWLTVEGATLGKQGSADDLIPKSFPPVAELLQSFTDNGGRIGVCPPCGKTHGVTDDNILPHAEWMGAAAVLSAGENRQVFSF
ncbi:MAG: DsrE family protein [Burkholderiales bacterium]